MKRIALFLFIMVSLQGCREDVNESTSSKNIFESLWTILDEKYCFFDAKNVDWDEIHDKYAARIDTIPANSELLFNTLGEMICELKDGHVNLYVAQNVIRYWKWFEDFDNPNFSEKLEKAYLGTNYKIASGLNYKMLNDSIGYITYRSFSASITDAGLDYILYYFKDCHGIILDVRENSGGNLSNVEKIASRFTEEKIIGSYIRHKIGKGHNDFSDYCPMYITPSTRKRYTKKVVILTNRKCYSATNTFISTMRQLPNVTIMGDNTGGGGGFPISSMLPNGWNVRFSSCPTYNSNHELIENGIVPDSVVSITESDYEKNIDTIIEKARSFLKE